MLSATMPAVWSAQATLVSSVQERLRLSSAQEQLRSSVPVVTPARVVGPAPRAKHLRVAATAPIRSDFAAAVSVARRVRFASTLRCDGCDPRPRAKKASSPSRSMKAGSTRGSRESAPEQPAAIDRARPAGDSSNQSAPAEPLQERRTHRRRERTSARWAECQRSPEAVCQQAARLQAHRHRPGAQPHSSRTTTTGCPAARSARRRARQPTPLPAS
jgi:hypothetical protein